MIATGERVAMSQVGESFVMDKVFTNSFYIPFHSFVAFYPL